MVILQNVENQKKLLGTLLLKLKSRSQIKVEDTQTIDACVRNDVEPSVSTKIKQQC